MKKRGTPVDCYILGDGPLREPLQRLIKKLNLQECVKLHGPQPQAKLADWYRAANLVVLPSLSEGVPNVLLEAQACGTAFVASNVGGIPEIADPLVHSLVPPGEPTGFANAILERLSKQSLLASRRFQPLSCEASARRITDIIDKCRMANPLTVMDSGRIVMDSDSAMMILNVASAMQKRRQ